MRRNSEKSVLVLLHLLLAVAIVVVANAAGEDMIKIWPMPQSVTNDQQGKTLCLAPDFQLLLTAPKLQAADDGDGSHGILEEAFQRMLDTLKQSHAVDANSTAFQTCTLLRGIDALLLSPIHQLEYGIDESYKLLVPSPQKPDYAHLEGKTVYGALHGIQTFSQLCYFNIMTRVFEVVMTPWSIIDQPRFSYRGLLIDSSRHYQPLPMIKKVIDSMAYAKLNVLHWHIVDTQSFPLEIPSYPKLWDGAYSVAERYTIADAAEIVSYAQRQGINVLAEIDVPGHARSWGTGYPSLWPSKDCQQPLDVSNEFTFQVIDGILSDLSKVFPFKFVHLGGDEVNTSCWTTIPHIKKWLENNGLNESQAYQYFVLRAQEIALSHGYEIINWEETFNNFGDKLSRKTVVHNWLGVGVAKQVVTAGLRCIVSNQDKWYLHYLDTSWQEVYMNEPLTNITDTKQQGLVIGGEVCMWGERVDGSDILQTIWPRAAAAAERLWTSYEKLAKDPVQVSQRLAHFRCLLNQRGVPAAPLNGLGRAAPKEPGSCFVQ